MPLLVVCALAALVASSMAQTNLIQDWEFTGNSISPWTDWRDGGYSPGLTSDGTTHIYCFAGTVGCGWLAQDLSSGLANVAIGETLNLTYAAYCRSQTDTQNQPCYTIATIDNQSWNDTHPYLTSDAAKNQWPYFSHTFTYHGTDKLLKFTTTIVGDQAMWYATNFSLATTSAAAGGGGAGSSSTSSSSSTPPPVGGGGSTKSSSSATGTPSGGAAGGSGKSSSPNTTAIAVGCSLGICVLVLAAAFLWFWSRRRRSATGGAASTADETAASGRPLNDKKSQEWVSGPSNPSSTPSPPHSAQDWAAQQQGMSQYGGHISWPSATMPAPAGPVQEWPQQGLPPRPSSTQSWPPAGQAQGRGWYGPFGGHPELQVVTPRPTGPDAAPNSGTSSSFGSSRPDVYSPYRA